MHFFHPVSSYTANNILVEIQPQKRANSQRENACTLPLFVARKHRAHFAHMRGYASVSLLHRPVKWLSSFGEPTLKHAKCLSIHIHNLTHTWQTLSVRSLINTSIVRRLIIDINIAWMALIFCSVPPCTSHILGQKLLMVSRDQPLILTNILVSTKQVILRSLEAILYTFPMLKLLFSYEKNCLFFQLQYLNCLNKQSRLSKGHFRKCQNNLFHLSNFEFIFSIIQIMKLGYVIKIHRRLVSKLKDTFLAQFVAVVR